MDEFRLLENPSSSKVIIQSFSQDSLKIIHDINPDIPLIQLIQYNEDTFISQEEITELKRYAVGIGVNYTAITESFVQKVRQENLELHPYTVNSENSILELIDMGATGVFTDYIDMVPSKYNN